MNILNLNFLANFKFMINSFSHGIMFHHFHNDDHLPSQGSINENIFRKMLIWLNKNYSILDAQEYLKKFEEKTLTDSEICLTFDDALKCQYDVAIPILNEFNIKAFFFVYTSVFAKNPEPLEIYRYFRTSVFKEINDFYKEFFRSVKNMNKKLYEENKLYFKKLNYLNEFPFYTNNDKWFRYLRDQYLDINQYHIVMNNLMKSKAFDIDNAKKKLWMTEDDLIKIYKKDHVLGLHSHSHPMQMHKLSKLEQELEYKKNYSHLEQIIGKPIKVMSHPCGNYNKNTIDVLFKLNLKLGFRSNKSMKKPKTCFEMPREDHTNILKEINK